MQVTRCLHTAILVADVQQAVAFYDRLLGLPKVERPFKYGGVWYQLPQMQVHLIEDPTFQAKLPNPEKLGRNPHIAFGVKDLDAVRSQLDSENYPYEMSASGRRALFLQDPDGNVVEITEES
ncbi:glyoxalase [Picosynechococcus sp. PCC 7003]|uniref:VOC family protein n=1 Tax=Picosynechococcus sp. PCC 7003 TaxID=374981 RepID=UPI000810BC66|nr:VOC family protein [Picosynechococcus sp. PCC 7003]ANV85445.1 glyoxalase [Picosynechococcus sp. PCC 7003]